MQMHENAPQKQVLVIDDDALVRMACKKVLSRANYHVIEAYSGTSGLDLFQKMKPDLVITDILMPDKEGLQTISEIRASRPDAKIVAMSGGGSTQNMTFLQLAQKMGADRILSKPFKPEDLLDIVRSLLGT